jgi:phosphoribosyl-AMP cyclohydrolase/phosphoribosyl-ATP pyrophosphohydrolase
METRLRFDRQGLIPAVIVDDASGDVLMVAFMNEEALQRTLSTGQTHFFSRSRNTIWHKGEQSGNVQDVKDIFVNCEENSLLIRVVQHGGAACHEGYRSCYYRRLLPDGAYETVAERAFDPATVYQQAEQAPSHRFPIASGLLSPAEPQLEHKLRQLYDVYLYLRDNDLSEQSHTSRLLQERSQSYLASRLADELQELAGVQSGEHVHAGRQLDTILEGSQVGYWLFLLAATRNVSFDTLVPQRALLSGYSRPFSETQAVEQRQRCLELLAVDGQEDFVHGLQLGFAFIGWACALAEVDPLAPADYDLEQMRRKGLV